jgi:hypothetical protein
MNLLSHSPQVHNCPDKLLLVTWYHNLAQEASLAKAFQLLGYKW